ncbi:MAG: hypothetical protein CL846_09045 [Crocinitomicaceae bacterium]|nr:hypothetical protein [Crocinitomicaceae bacterium]
MNIIKTIILIIIFLSIDKINFANNRNFNFQNSIAIEETTDLIVLKNKNELIPLKKLNLLKIASLSLGNSEHKSFESSLNNYAKITHYHFNTFSSKKVINAMIEELNQYNLVLVNADSIDMKIDAMISLLADENNIVFHFFGDKKQLESTNLITKINALILGSGKTNDIKSSAAELTFGGIPCNGKLKEKINNEYDIGYGLKTIKTRLSFHNSFSRSIKPRLLKIDSIINEAIEAKAFPGCQILAAKDGYVFLNKSYGNHTYDSLSKKVTNDDIYDLASITKIASSSAILMNLQSNGLFNVDSTLGTYIPELVDSTNFENLNLKQIFTHQAGLVSWIPFHLKTLENGKPSSNLYSKIKTPTHQNRVANDLYILNSYRDTILNRIVNSKIKPIKRYKYSDLGFYLVNEIIPTITNKSQQDYSQLLYDRLGIYNIGYNPREKWELNRLVPTENDMRFRHQLIQGDVHDQGAALMGGVSGHAGLFSTAQDLAVVMQMFLNKGIYGEDTLIDPNVMDYYATAPFVKSNRNRRGITFDKPVINGAGGPTCFGCASNKSFGHSGFTGNLTWADPESGIVYVFLSNRVYPDAENRKLITMNIRTNVQKVITDACGFSTLTTIE